MKKLLHSLALFSLVFALFLVADPSLANNTLLPEAGDLTLCVDVFELEDPALIRQRFADNPDGQNQLLGCAIQYGEFDFWMFPYLIRYILGFILPISGVLAILMVIIGAYHYTASGLTEDKAKGRQIITYALGGMVLALSAWFIVNLILLALTS